MTSLAGRARDNKFHLGLAANDYSAKAGTLQTVTFGGKNSVAIIAGAPAFSDPVHLAVKPGTELVVSALLETPLQNNARGGAGLAVAAGDQVLKDTLEQPKLMTGRLLVSGVSILSESSTKVIVALGDSITDGNRATPGALAGWPEELSRRLISSKRRFSLLNAGIGGNRVLSPGWGASALGRLDRDALRVEGISHLVLLEGINDIGMIGRGLFGKGPEISAEDLIAGYRQIVERAHARGVKVYIGTLTPIAGSASHSSPEKDTLREALNHWIRNSGEPDAVIDFDAMVRDPANPSRFLARYDSGDHLHPSDAGYKAMGDGIDLNLFR